MAQATIEAIGVLETESIAAGVETADAMAKMAPVEFVDAFMVTPGKYVVVVHGDPSSVESSVERGREVAGGPRSRATGDSDVLLEVTPVARNEDVHAIVGRIQEKATQILVQKLDLDPRATMSFVMSSPRRRRTSSSTRAAAAG